MMWCTKLLVDVLLARGKMVDYSKWDKMDFSDSSDNEEEDNKVPRVTALDSGSSVKFGAGNVEISKSSSTSQPRQSLSSTTSADIPVVSSSVSGDTIDISTMNDINNKPKDNMQQDTNNKMNNKLQTQLTLNGGEHYCIVNSPTSNQKEELKLPIYWSQDRYTVTLRLGFPPSIFPSKSIRIHVKGALKYTDRFSAVGNGSGNMSGYKGASSNSSFGSVEVVSLNKGEETILLKGNLPRPIHLNEGEEEIDFEIEDNHHLEMSDNNSKCTKLVSITLPKAVPMAGLVLWWDCPLIGFPQIDVSNIQGRQGSKGDSKQDDKKEAWKNAWDEAHVMFKEKVKTRVKEEINVDE